jgi:ankyrin repeat protein
VLRFFVNPRVNLNAINNAHQTPLEVVGNPQQQKREILQRMPHPSSIPNIFEAATRGTVEDVAYYVSRNPASVNERDHVVNTPLHLAARNNPNVEVLRYLIARSADANARDYNGNTPLHLAARSNSSTEVLRFLVTQSADINALDGAGRTPLDVATQENGPILMLEGGRSGRQL